MIDLEPLEWTVRYESMVPTTLLSTIWGCDDLAPTPRTVCVMRYHISAIRLLGKATGNPAP